MTQQELSQKIVALEIVIALMQELKATATADLNALLATPNNGLTPGDRE